MNAIFTKHTINNTGNNEIPKSNRTKQELYLTIYFSKKIRLKNKGRFQRKRVLIFFLVVLRKLVNFNEFQYYFILNLRYIHTSLYTFSAHIINHNIDYWSMTEQL